MEDKSMIESIQTFAARQALAFIERDPEKNFSKLLDWADKFDAGNLYQAQRKAFRQVLEHPESNWYQLLLRVFQLDKGVRETFLENFIINASLIGGTRQQAVRRQENCNVPWAILLDPTSACNLRCTGCWAAEYGHSLNLETATIDRIIQQGKALGVYMYIYTGGEPLARKADLIQLCETHADCEFLAFTNGTLIDEEFCQEMLRVKNFVPAIGLEGFAAANDSRRGREVLTRHWPPCGCCTRTSCLSAFPPAIPAPTGRS